MQTLQQSYDAVIIGSGIGGLSVASTLAQLRGFKCLVLEQHWAPGGIIGIWLKAQIESFQIHSVGRHDSPI